jgi:hypothetical protein
MQGRKWSMKGRSKVSLGMLALVVLICSGCEGLGFNSQSIQGQYRAYGAGTEVATEWAGVVMVLQEDGQGKFVQADDSEEPFDYSLIDETVGSARILGVEINMPSGRIYGLQYDGDHHFTLWISDTVTAVIWFSKV